MAKLLFLCHRVPFPPDKGEKIRAWHVLKHLARSQDVHLGCLADDPADLAQLGELREICASVGCFGVRPALQKARALASMRSGRPLTPDVFYSRGLRDWVAQTLARHPIERIFVFSSAMASYVSGVRGQVRILDMVDIDSEKWRAYAPHHLWPMRALYRREADALLALERQLVLKFDTTLFVSEAEARRFAVLAPECRNRIGWLENGVDLERFSPTEKFPRPFPESVKSLVFTGTMNYWPNVDAVSRFVDAVLPLVRQRQPHVHLYIVGAAPSRAVLRLRRIPGVTVTGTVPDVRPFLAHADVAVAPLRIARGIQNKVLEAMAMGRPVVATPEALEGLGAIPGRDLLVATAPEEMARYVLEIIDKRHPSLGAAARLAVEQNHRWSHTLRRLDTFFPPAGAGIENQHPPRTMLSPATAV
jgi:sugar transferase (PEP-CTERM/EpsH1 system associated)